MPGIPEAHEPHLGEPSIAAAGAAAVAVVGLPPPPPQRPRPPYRYRSLLGHALEMGNNFSMQPIMGRGVVWPERVIAQRRSNTPR